MPGAFSQNVYNFSLAPEQNQTLLVESGSRTKLSVDVMWEEENVSVAAWLNGSGPIDPDVFTPAINGSWGMANFSIKPSGKWEEGL